MLGHVLSSTIEYVLLEHFNTLDFNNLTIGHVINKPLKFLEGKPFKEFARNQKLPCNEALLKFMRMTDLRAALLYRNIDAALLRDFIIDDRSIIASNGASFPHKSWKHERNFSSFPVFLNMISKEPSISFEKAITKITSVPAIKYRIKQRGLIREQYYADVVVLKDDAPDTVIINGKIVFEHGKFRERRAGAILRHR
ncbi:amidohydrolase family protein [Candidatus Jorgensenbacteria bacterium]|nr:amidohydrolase family protein [Candidatus Jorgensenbacteria bacterium]